MFSHAFDFSFEVVSRREDASDVTPAMLRAALIRRAAGLSATELSEACGCFDTAEVPSHDGPHLRLEEEGGGLVFDG